MTTTDEDYIEATNGDSDCIDHMWHDCAYRSDFASEAEHERDCPVS